MSLQDPNVVNPARKKRVAIVIANPATSTTTGWLWLSKTSYALRRLRLWMFADSLVSWRPSSSRCSTLFGSCSDHGFRCTWKSSRSDTS